MQGPGASGDFDSRPLPPRRPPPRPAPRSRGAAGSSGTALAAKPTASELLATVASARYQNSQLSEGGLYWVMTRVPVVDPGEGNVVRGALFMVAPSFWGTPLFFDFKPWLLAFAAAIAIFLLCWLPFIRGLSRSISRVTLNTGRIAEGDFKNHLPENRSDEIGQLSVSINRMAGRLSGFVTGQKRFLGDIAHELSAPIARVQFALGILEQQATEEQREAVEDLREEIGQMSGLVSELLSFSKAGLEAGSANLKAIDVMPVLRQAAERESAGGAPIVVTESEAVMAMAEQNLLLRAIANLVRNAVRYAGADGAITVSARHVDDAVIVTVADSGPGLPAEELDRVFAPFYRPDTSRTRDTGGAGLGLAIVKSCIEATGGTVQCRNREPHGLEVEIRLKPANI